MHHQPARLGKETVEEERQEALDVRAPAAPALRQPLGIRASLTTEPPGRIRHATRVWPSLTLLGAAQYLVDEPNADEYAGLATTVAKIRSQVSKFESYQSGATVLSGAMGPQPLSLSPVAVAVSTVRSQDPHALSFINLLPSNVSGYGMDNATGWAKEWGAKDYRSYVQELVDTVRPDIICFGARTQRGASRLS